MEAIAFLELAQTLSGQSNDEAALRTSVGRSYYALHNFFTQFILAEGFFLPKSGTRHDLVFQDLHNCNVEEIRQIAKSLDDLHDERNDADYELEITKFQEPNHAVLLFLKAKKAYEDFQKLTSNRKKRNQIAKGIRDNRKTLQRQI
ncbi:hypothetical protein ES703_67385 [subsurface metagenome]